MSYLISFCGCAMLVVHFSQFSVDDEIVRPAFMLKECKGTIKMRLKLGG